MECPALPRQPLLEAQLEGEAFLPWESRVAGDITGDNVPLPIKQDEQF